MFKVLVVRNVSSPPPLPFQLRARRFSAATRKPVQSGPKRLHCTSFTASCRRASSSKTWIPSCRAALQIRGGGRFKIELRGLRCARPVRSSCPARPRRTTKLLFSASEPCRQRGFLPQASPSRWASLAPRSAAPSGPGAASRFCLCKGLQRISSIQVSFARAQPQGQRYSFCSWRSRKSARVIAFSLHPRFAAFSHATALPRPPSPVGTRRPISAAAYCVALFNAPVPGSSLNHDKCRQRIATAPRAAQLDLVASVIGLRQRSFNASCASNSSFCRATSVSHPRWAIRLGQPMRPASRTGLSWLAAITARSCASRVADNDAIIAPFCRLITAPVQRTW